MAMASSNSHVRGRPISRCLPLSAPPTSPALPTKPTCSSVAAAGRRSRGLCCRRREAVEVVQQETGDLKEHDGSGAVFLYSISPLPLILLLGALPGAETLKSVFGPFAEQVKSLNLPGWFLHWGHAENMAVVLLAMGGYGTYLGFRIKFSNDVEEKANAKDLHPKLLGGLFFFFALGATGGVTSLLILGKPILESPHAVTGLIGLTLLTIQSILPALFGGNPGLRNTHGVLGCGIMTLFLLHAALGLQLGLSY